MSYPAAKNVTDGVDSGGCVVFLNVKVVSFVCPRPFRLQGLTTSNFGVFGKDELPDEDFFFFFFESCKLK